ncbi:CDP-diacylglycerol--glycerol-3-phosphate 3-phosphatidyltransferase [Frischella sp. Ac48]|uniref:CDP-diacylglycerol--glycerol-3-phosphate 3-phosphatidyltransferase n=1 Tax=Frischella japonica TaxID=2741544 RepID=A0ABR7QXX2_9GAMM|nr:MULTISPECIES: CDP-diacylglycerol--glycerol-3-phosphate 3-phosphatidyltransferase [Frischella]MBC9131049.1 CDP-diacylglycerol--glycerol-3-phosphate 3-phosphatidyltransferase [Frischella japonica]MBX4133874.1 CDP-diacylglycerol--glycerol-3-phosphate 3-phosphatidyltransferase [Frischella sp. Ac48]
MKFNVPIYLTLFRLILIPFFVLSFYITGEWSAFFTALIFLIAAFTDILDGYLARRLNQTTRFGAFLDPVADKIMVTIALILITEHYDTWWITIPAIIMISREIIISALREWMAEIGKRKNVAVSGIGKIKTITQMTALTWLLWRPCELVINAGLIALYIAAILTLWSMIEYLWIARCDLLEDIK